MGLHDKLHQALFARCSQRLHVALQNCLERLGVLPFRMGGSLGLHAVEREGELGIHRMFDPQRAVIVEDGDALRFRNEVGRVLGGHLLDERDDGRFRRGVVP
ncbi:hypothetical protein D9M69_611450 [compost metagenome]